MIKSEEQRQQEMRAVQNEWWGKLTDAEKSKATGMVLDQATGWWAVADVDSRERLMRTYIALKENAAPIKDSTNGNTEEDNSTEGADEGTAEGDSTENSETTEQNDAEASDETGEANPAEENAAPKKTKAAPAKKGGKKTSKK